MVRFLTFCLTRLLKCIRIFAFNTNIFSLDYIVSNNIIDFNITTKIIPSTNWWAGVSLRDNNNFGDIIVCWNDIYNNINLEAYTIDPIIINNSSLIFQYQKSETYFNYKNATVFNASLNFKFSRPFLTNSFNDTQIINGQSLEASFVKSDLLFPSNYQYMYSFTIPIDTQPNNNFMLQMFYPSIFTFFIYFVFILAYIITQTTRIKCLNKNINLHYFGYHTVGVITFMILYLIWWLGMVVYCFTMDDRAEILFRLGIWIMLNTANVLLPITRNSIWLLIFKIPYLKIIHIHKYMAILCILSVLIKFITVLIYYKPDFLIVVLNTATGGSPLAGTISTFCYLILGIFSSPFIRKRFYEVFYFIHRFISLLAIATAVWHYVVSIYYILPSLLLYLIDLFMRFLNIKKGVYLTLDNVGDKAHNTKCIILNIKVNSNFNTYPGCYFLICIRNISSYEWHPISLIKKINNKLIFCAKDMGENTWTGKLRILDTDAKGLFDKEVYLQGPYGNINITYTDYKYIFTIAGGIGITSIFSVLMHINEMNYCKKLPKLEKILFVWIVPHTSLIDYFNNYILELNHIITDIHIFVTKQEIDPSYPSYIKALKPDIYKFVNSFIQTGSLDPRDIALITCGPERLITDIKAVSNKLDIDIFCEDF